MVFHHSTCTLSLATEFYETVNNDVHVHMQVLRVTSGRVKEKASQLFISAHLHLRCITEIMHCEVEP